MPNILVTTYECRNGLLPHLCAKCGTPTESAARSLALGPALQFLMNFLLVICPPLFVVLAFALRRRIAYGLPMCPPHRTDREWRDRLSSRTYLVVCATYLGAPVVGYLISPEPDEEFGFTIGFLVYYLVWVAWVTPVAILWTRTVRTSTVTNWGIRLSGVHPDFVAAVREDRARDMNPARLSRYGDLRDDYEDRVD